MSDSTQITILRSELDSEKAYSDGLRTENKHLHELVKSLNHKLKLAEHVVSFCRRDLGVAEHDNLHVEIAHLKDLLFIAAFDYDADNFDDSMPISSQVSPSHHSKSFQVASPFHPSIHSGDVLSPMNVASNSLVGRDGERFILLEGGIPDIADVGPPLSPPGSTMSIGNICDPVADAILNEQDQADREDSERGSVEVEHDLVWS